MRRRRRKSPQRVLLRCRRWGDILKLERKYTEPEISFSEWAERQGYDSSMLARDSDYAEVIGGALTASTKAAQGKLKAPAKRVEYTQQLKSAYQNLVATGEIKSVEKSQPLDWNNEQDRAYTRMQIKRAKSPEMKNIWQTFYDNHFQDVGQTVRENISNRGGVNVELKPKRNFYDLEKLKSIPIYEVAQAFGVEVKKVGNDYWCAIRQERTPSCKLYTKTNSFCDFGAANYGGDTIELTAFLNSCSREDAIETLANTFGIQPENLDGSRQTHFPSDRQLAKIGIYGDRASKNIDFHIEKYGLEIAKEISKKFSIRVEEMAEYYPVAYHQMLSARAVPYVLSLRQAYLTELRSRYDMAALFHLELSPEDECFTEARELLHDAKEAERILYTAIQNHQKVPFKMRSYDLAKDYAAITNGTLSVELTGSESIEYRNLKAILKSEHREMGFSELPKAQYDSLCEQLGDITAYSAFVKGDTVKLAYDAEFSDLINDLIHFTQGEQMADETAELTMLPTV